MAFKLESGEPVRQGLRRVAREELDGVIAALGEGRVHEARTGLKKLRSITRKEPAFRDAGRKLSDARDAQVMLETLDSFHPHRFPAIRKTLVARRKTPPSTGDAAAMLAAVQPVVKVPNAKDALDDAAEAFATARKSGEDEDFHDWRKKVKRLWYQLRVLRRKKRLTKKLEHLADLLGDDHNLVVLRNAFDDPKLHSLVQTRLAVLRAEALDLGKKLL